MTTLTSYLDSLQKKIDAMKHWHDIAVKDEIHRPWWEDGPYPDMNILIAINRELLSAVEWYRSQVDECGALPEDWKAPETGDMGQCARAALEKCEAICSAVS